MGRDKHKRREAVLRQLGWFKSSLEKLDQVDHQFFLARLFTLVAGGLLSTAAVFTRPGLTGLGVVFVSIAAFVVVVILHQRVELRQKRYRRALSMASTQLARLELDWEGIPDPPGFPVAVSHPFASDLNLVGGRSLHQLIDTATSRGGSERLAAWLLDPVPNPAQIHERQALIQEMLPLTGFRTHLWLKGLEVKEETQGYWEGEALLRWIGESAAPRSLVPMVILLTVLAITNLALFILYLLGILPAYWVASLALYALIYLSKYGDYKNLFGDVFRLGKSLEQFKGILDHLEKYPYPPGSRFAQLSAPFWEAEGRPSRFLKKLILISTAASLGNHQFLAFFFNTILPWNLIFAAILDSYKKTLGRSLPHWLDTWYELEALSSLANFSYLNPSYSFPKFLSEPEGAGQAVFEARNLGHPLLRDEVKICNDFSIQKLGVVAIVTGSNMSGKSTFLRTLGVNLCLANAGAAVNATEMRLVPFRLFTCIQVSDSLSNGISYFYAEVRRLKALLEALELKDRYPLFFLIDEIFRGTNNRERMIGSRAYVRSLVRSFGTGLISTHDLDLVHLADEDADILNYHFREDIRDGRMVFDYKLRPGPSPTTNAIRIMELEGLPVE